MGRGRGRAEWAGCSEGKADARAGWGGGSRLRLRLVTELGPSPSQAAAGAGVELPPRRTFWVEAESHVHHPAASPLSSPEARRPWEAHTPCAGTWGALLTPTIAAAFACERELAARGYSRRNGASRCPAPIVCHWLRRAVSHELGSWG